jgi:hypothetical protein
VPYDKYRVTATKDCSFPISDKLQAVHDKVIAGNFVDDTGTPRISFTKYVNISWISKSSEKGKGMLLQVGM